MNLDGDKDVDDFLGTHETTWDLLNLSKDAQPFINLENEISLDGKEVKELIFNRGQSNGKMLLLLPHNAKHHVTTQFQQYARLWRLPRTKPKPGTMTLTKNKLR